MKIKTTWLRVFGPVLLVILLVQLDAHQILNTLSHANLYWVLFSTVLIFPLIAIKTIRWQLILQAQAIHYRFWPAYGAYFASLFIGFLTPGRLGEFTKALYVWKDSQDKQPVSVAQALSGVIADRLFDLGAVILLSVFAIAHLQPDQFTWVLIGSAFLLMGGGLLLFLNDRIYAHVQACGLKAGKIGAKLFAANGWVTEVRNSLNQIQGTYLLMTVLLTILAYALYFWQCYLLSMALNLPLNIFQVSYAIALGGLVTLLPISISGLGTREAVMVAYLGSWGISAEAALGFSLLVFITFYIGGSLLGAAAWLWRPTPILKDAVEKSPDTGQAEIAK
jgi:glycosyltransferase 2 family protein